MPVTRHQLTRRAMQVLQECGQQVAGPCTATPKGPQSPYHTGAGCLQLILALSARWHHFAAPRAIPVEASPREPAARRPPNNKQLCLRPSRRARVDCAPTNRHLSNIEHAKNLIQFQPIFIFFGFPDIRTGRVARRPNTATTISEGLGSAARVKVQLPLAGSCFE